MNISGEEGFIMTMGSYLSLFLKIMIILRNKNFGALGNFAKDLFMKSDRAITKGYVNAMKTGAASKAVQDAAKTSVSDGLTAYKKGLSTWGKLNKFSKGAIIGTGLAATAGAVGGGKYVYDSKNALEGNMGEENGAGY